MLRRLGIAVMSALTALLVFALMAMVIRKPGDAALYPPAPNTPVVSIYLIENGYHTSLVIPTARLIARGGPTAQALKGSTAPFTEVGWGDARFYIQTGMSPFRAVDGLRALFAPNNASAVMFDTVRGPPDMVWGHGVSRVDLSAAGFERLAASIDRTFDLGRDGAPQRLPGGEARFYKSVEHFHISHLCNHWAAERLNAAGLPIRPGLDVLPAGLIFDLETDGVRVHRSDGH